MGTKRDAHLFALGANSEHGLARSRADKRKAIEILLRDPEWSQRGDNWIAKTACVSDKTVAAARRDFGIPKSTTVETANGRTIVTTNIGPRAAATTVERDEEDNEVKAATVEIISTAATELDATGSEARVPVVAVTSSTETKVLTPKQWEALRTAVSKLEGVASFARSDMPADMPAAVAAAVSAVFVAIKRLVAVAAVEGGIT
jgi:hypothetical protein